MVATKPAPAVVQIDDWRKDAVSDKSFLSVLVASVGVVGSRSDIVLAIISLVVGVAGVVIARLCFEQLMWPAVTAKLVQQWSNFGAGISVAILGFLIAGFSVFATVTRPTFFHVLAQFRLETRKISEFKFVFYNFIYIFAHYIFYLAVCMAFAAMFVPNSPLWYIGQIIHERYPQVVDIILGVSGALIISYSLFSLLLLRSFLWNLYQALLFAIFYDEPKSDGVGGGE